MPRDLNQLAHKTLLIATGKDVEPEKPPDDGKDPAAVSLGRRGGLKGGKARWKGVSAKKAKGVGPKSRESSLGKSAKAVGLTGRNPA